MNANAPCRPETLMPHDLLWLRWPCGTVLPAWFSADWRAAAPVVVRRARQDGDGAVPVGLRGRTRGQRHAMHVACRHVMRRITPEALARAHAWETPAAHLASPCVRLLARLAPALDAAGFTWGVTGGVGFALASGLPVLRPDSDLDLLLRMPAPITSREAVALLRTLHDPVVRVDVQIDTGHGAFALAEWAAARGAVLMKTRDGPRLADDPWRMPHGAVAAEVAP